MVTLKLSEKQLDDLYKELFSNADPRARKKCLIVYLRAKGRPCHEIADIVRVDKDTVTNAVKKYIQGGLARLLKEGYRKPKSQLEPYSARLKELFEKQPPHTVNQAIEIIFEETGVRLKHSACQSFLKKIGMKCRRCGLVPGKAMDDEKQCEAQQVFHDQKLQPLLDVAKQSKRTVLFVDAAHFVMGAFLGMVWCFTRLLLPSASGRKRHHVLGAYDPITHEAITVTNDTYINRWVLGEFLDKIAGAYAGTGRPITLVLDNASVNRCGIIAIHRAQFSRYGLG
jgi:transposase